MEGIARYCQNCKAPCAGNFRKVVDLQYSGLVIYVHTKKDKQKKAGDLKYEDTFILHNIGSKQIKKPEYVGELSRFKTKCAQCKSIVERVRSLLDEIKIINKNEVIGVCEYCKRATSLSKKCRRCDFIVSEFISTHEKIRERQERFKVWLCKVNRLLQAIVDGESVCQHRVYRDTELERILHALKEPSGMREPDIGFFPNLDQEKLTPLQRMSENKETLEELLSKIEFVGEHRDSSSKSLYPSPSEEMCLCKYLKEKVEGGISGLELISDASKALGFGLAKDQNKKMVHVSVNNLNKVARNGEVIDKSLFDSETGFGTKVTKPRKIKQELFNDLHDQLTMGSSKDPNHDLIKLLVNLSDLITHELSKCLNKDQMRGQSKKEVPQKLSLHLTNALVQKFANVNKALVAGVLDKNLVRELASDINKEIGRMPLDELIKIIKEFTNLCKPAVQGIPKTLNLKLVQGLISDASKALGLGFSKDQNKKIVHISINKLNKVLTSTEEVQRLSIGLNKVLSKDVSKVLRSRHSKGKTSFEVARNGEAIYKSLSDFETRIGKEVTKPRKSATANPLQLKQQTSEKQSKKDLSSDKKSRKDSRMERANKIGSGQYSSNDKDTESLKKKIERTEGVNGKENLSPEYEKKSKYLKSRSQEKLSTPPLRDAKELSDILLHKNQVKEEKFKLNKHRHLVKLTEIERIRLKKQTMKNVTKMKKMVPRPTNRDEVVTETLTFGDTTPFDMKDIEEKPIDAEPLLSNTRLQSADDSIARRNLKYQTLFKDNAVKYQLSNEKFIRKGWTILPIEKIMRKMNIYRMEPANSHNCWFERHQQDGELFYDSGQKLADIDHNGRGHWYYRNGAIALDYQNAQESNVGQRYVVYSSGTEMECGKIRPRTILALFDVLGHGVIYDLHGNIRLKYNQSEGVLVDPKIGPPGKWKWHTLNDPPVLQRVFIDTCLKERDPKLERVKKLSISQDTTEVARPAHPEMVAIELDNFVKVKRSKLKQKFRPFQIRSKAVMLNEQFSLKILDQATIYLLYRDGVTRLKLNLGMLLKSDEIIDTVTSDMGDVTTPYDIRPAKSESVENIQKILKTVRSGKGT